jgi:myosin heavy subunit
LEDTIIELQSNHTDEINSLEELILEKDLMINETDSKMSMISVYVDQLEERLASFAVARRDINVREEVCKEIEEREIQTSKDYASIQKQMKEISASRDELKNLVDLMTEERLTLSKERDEMIAEKEMLIDDESKLREELSSLQESIAKLQHEVDTARMSLERANAEIEEKEVKLNELHELNMSSKVQLEQQEESLKDSVAHGESLKQEVSRLEEENKKIFTLVITLEEKIELLVAELEEKSLITQENIHENETNAHSSDGTNGNDFNEDATPNETEVHDDNVCHEEGDSETSGHNEGKEAAMEQAFIPPPPPPPLSDNDGTIETDEVTDNDKNYIDEISNDSRNLIQPNSHLDGFDEGQLDSIQYPPPPPPSLNEVEEPEMKIEQISLNKSEFDGVTGEADFLEGDNVHGHTGENWEKDEISQDDLGELEQRHLDDGSIEEDDNSIISDINIQGDQESDDFEVLSDDDNRQPQGYEEDHFDNEESESMDLDEEEDDDGSEPAFPSSDDEESVESIDKDLGEESSDTILPSHTSIKTSKMQEGRRGSLADSSQKGRNVPLRNLRKKFSRLTGVHGLFTPPSKPAFVNQGSKSQ